jgi:hypothetical protein
MSGEPRALNPPRNPNDKAEATYGLCPKYLRNTIQKTTQMDRVNIKYAPAIHDFTAEEAEEDDEGMEAVLMDSKAKVEDSKSNGRFMTQAKSDERELLELIRKREWSRLMERCQTNPHLAYVKFASASAMNKGNLVFHEVCKHNPPIHVLEAVHDANESAAMIKGYGGYLPLHHACASGASDEVIRYIVAKYPEAVSMADEHDHALPLHLVCKMGTSEDMFMLLLSHFPDAATVQDDFGRLPMDYAKNIRSPGTRDIALKCLNIANWLQKSANFSKQRTESEYQHRIRGYEESQAKQLKMIKEVHEEELFDLESEVKAQQKDLSKKSSTLERVEAELELKSMEVEKQTKALNKIQASLDRHMEQIQELTAALEATRGANELLSLQLEEQKEELEQALDDVETLNQHSEWLESVVRSIRKIANNEAPLIKSLHRREASQSMREMEVTKERSLSQGFKEGPASKKYASSIPKFGKGTSAAVDEDTLVVIESRSEACDSELDSVARTDIE